jgi:hypothetical protein
MRYGDLNLLWEKLQDKYYKSMTNSDLYFYVGTISQFPTWLIVGLYYPPKQLALPRKSQNRTLDEIFTERGTI